MPACWGPSLFCLQYEALAKGTVTGTTLFLCYSSSKWQRGHPKGGNQTVGTLNYTTVGVLDILVLKFFSPTSCVIAKVAIYPQRILSEENHVATTPIRH
jgi:hypothetical protein